MHHDNQIHPYHICSISFANILCPKKNGVSEKRNCRNSRRKWCFVSWRLLGTEAQNTQFDLYRTENKQTKKLNEKPLCNETNFLYKTDEKDKNYNYFVKYNTEKPRN